MSTDVVLGQPRLATVAMMVALWAWCALLTFPMIVIENDLVELSGPTSMAFALGQFAGLTVFSCAALLAFPGQAIEGPARFPAPQLAVFAIFFLSLFLQLHDQEIDTLTGIAYTLMFLGAAVALSLLWALPPQHLETCLSGAAVALCAFAPVAIAVHGIPEGRNIGSIQPNSFGTPLLAAFILSQFRPGLVGAAVRILSLAMVALVSSRFAIIGCVLAFAACQLTFNPLRLRNAAVLGLAIVLALVFADQIAAILAIDDADRGLLSGFSGRDQNWDEALAGIVENPLGLGFKRASALEAHNGYLKTVLEFGIIGGGLIIFSFAGTLVMAAMAAILGTVTDQRQRRFACARFAGLLAVAFADFFQPQIFNLGDPLGILFLFLFFRPRAFPPSTRFRPRETREDATGQSTPA